MRDLNQSQKCQHKVLNGIDLDDLLKGVQNAGGPLQGLSFSHIENGSFLAGWET